jgi:HAD superfamily hydrolase (TIGR01662 family)
MTSRLKKQIIFFDLGDTLIYFDGDWGDVLRRSTKRLWKFLCKSGYPINREQFKQDFSNRMRKYYLERNKDLKEYTSACVLLDYMNDLGYPNPDDMTIREAMNAMYSVSQEYWNLEIDTTPTLEWLQSNGYRLGLISNASDKDDVYSLLQQFKLTNFFEQIIISAEFGLRKPHKEIFQEGLSLFSCEPQDCFMVGDRLDMDILGAKQIGMTSIWISRRSIHKGNGHLYDVIPDYEIQSLEELKIILENEI